MKKSKNPKNYVDVEEESFGKLMSKDAMEQVSDKVMLPKAVRDGLVNKTEELSPIQEAREMAGQKIAKAKAVIVSPLDQVRKFFETTPKDEVLKYLDSIKHLRVGLSANEFLNGKIEEAIPWISVDERLPDHENNVLAVLDGEACVMAYFSFKEGGEIFKVWGIVYDGLNGDPIYDDNYYPTLWMEIPKPPKPTDK